MIDFDEVYQDGAPWDIGRPQNEFVQLEAAGEILGSVLDVGCGTGENALFLAAQGHETWGIDITASAINAAKAKAKERNLHVTFLKQNALDLHALGKTFETVIDSGLFHVLSDEERPKFATNLASVLSRRGTYFMLCFSELQPGSYGPRRVTQGEIKNTFGRPWHINYIRAALMESARSPSGIKAWLASISRE
ncbi:MAG TPA: methyltransferase domain-containing protein [Candidatus Acidoferrales bacterium]|nr:methyltransferase domain-containing protein [Candidatus Acidoferrales bacterium]